MQIWSPTRAHVRVYGGRSPHRDHVHVGFTRAGSQRTQFPGFVARLSQMRADVQNLGEPQLRP